VLATTPELAVRLKLPAKPEPEVVETSKPVGAVTVKLPESVDPLTVKVRSAEAVP
jgi:hypothetical protein